MNGGQNGYRSCPMSVQSTPVGEHSVLPHSFNDDLGEHCLPLWVYECK